MICSTSTESLLTLNSDKVQPFLFRRVPPAARELGGFPDARAEDADGLGERFRAGLFDFRRRGAHVREPVVAGPQLFPVAEQPAPRAVEHVLHQTLRVDGIPEAVVVDDAGDVRPWGEHRL